MRASALKARLTGTQRLRVARSKEAQLCLLSISLPSISDKGRAGSVFIVGRNGVGVGCPGPVFFNSICCRAL